MDDPTPPPTLPESPPVPAHEVARMASTALRREVVLRRTWWGRTVFLKRVRGTAAWISALRHFFFVVLGKLMAPLIYWVFVHFRPDPMILAVGFSVATVLLSLYLLPRLKGVIIAIQWSRRMHGFGGV